jgi:hypothetical protein
MKTQRCARCPKIIRPEDPRVKEGRYTYCTECKPTEVKSA